MSEELLPCPFCQGRTRLLDESEVPFGNPFGLVSDHTEKCFLSPAMLVNWDHIPAAWNTRAPDPRIAELEAQMAGAKAALDDESELLTIAYMSGSHRSTTAHRQALGPLIAIARDWPLGTRVRKANPEAPEWESTVVGYYSSTKTPAGLVMECTATGARWQCHVEPAKRMEKVDG